MKMVSLIDAQQQLPELLDAAQTGEAIVIVNDDRLYQLTAMPSRKPRPRPPVTGSPRAGSCAGLIVVPDDYKEPLEELREYMA